MARLPQAIDTCREGDRCNNDSLLCTIPIDIWENIFILCLPPTESGPNPRVAGYKPCTMWTAPLLLCRVCSAWRRVAMSLPKLWTHMSVEVSLGKAHPSAALVTRWLRRSGELPLTLSLHQANESYSNRAVSEEILAIYCCYIRRWRDVTLDLANSVYHGRPKRRECRAPLLERFYMKLRHRGHKGYVRGLFRILKQAPRLSTLSVSSISALTRRKTPLAIPWSQLTHVAIDFDVSVEAGLLLLNDCHNIKGCALRIEPVLSLPSVPPITQKTLHTLELSIETKELAIFLNHVTLLALTSITIYGLGIDAPSLDWPQQEMDNFLLRSNTRLLCLELHKIYIQDTQFIHLLRQPAMESLVDLVVDYDSDWMCAPCVSHTALGALTFGENTTQSLLPALESIKIWGLGCKWHIDCTALLNMVESRWRHFERCHAVQLRRLETQLNFPSEYTAKLKELENEGLELYLDFCPF